jgi:hypothetical protein
MRPAAALVGLCALVAVGCFSKLTIQPIAVNEHKIELREPTAAELQTLRGGNKGEPFKVGIAREVPAAQQRISLAKLDWQPAAGGELVATISIRSPGAKSLRVGVTPDTMRSVKLFFRGKSLSTAPISQGVPSDSKSAAVFWSPVLQGDTAWIDVQVSTLPAAGTVLEIPLISHLR